MPRARRERRCPQQKRVATPPATKYTTTPMRVALLISLLAVAACPASSSSGTSVNRASETPACAKVGQTCEFSPGKLGTCVYRDDCDAGAATCFACQSQH